MRKKRREKKMKKKYILIVVLIIAGLVGGYYYYISMNAEEVVDNMVKETIVIRDDLRIDFLADGSVVVPVVDIKLYNSGILKEIYFNEGEMVNEGDLIAVLDDEELQFKLNQSLLAIETIEAKIRDEKLNVTQEKSYQETIISYLEKDIEAAKIELSTMQEYSSIFTPVEIVKQGELIAELEERLVLETMKMSSIRAGMTTQYLLDIEDIKIDIDSIKKAIDRTEVYAIDSGTIIDVASTVNSNINSGSVLMTLQQNEERYISAIVSEMDIYQVEVGQKVLAEFESNFGFSYEGYVTYVNPVPKIDNNGIVSYEVKIIMEDFPENTLSGVTSFLSFILKEREDVLIIPNSTVILQDSKQYVELKTESGSVLQAITTGLTDGVSVEVIEGLLAGDVILTHSLGE